MTKVVYTPSNRIPLWRAILPWWIAHDILRHRELILAYAKRDYQAAHRNTYLGAAWAMLTPLILLALFTFVFGYIFQGRFNATLDESPIDFALALFIGISMFMCVGTALTAGPGLMYANSAYVKSLAFPLEVLSVAQTYNIIRNLLISLGLCLVAFLITNGFLHWTTIFVVLHVACIAAMVLAISWFLSAVAVFVPDTPAVTSPLSMVLMFLSGVFFSIENMPPDLKILFQLNPLAVLIQQARAAILYGETPDFGLLAIIAAALFVAMTFGYVFFTRTKAAFADVM